MHDTRSDLTRPRCSPRAIAAPISRGRGRLGRCHVLTAGLVDQLVAGVARCDLDAAAVPG